MTVVVAVSLAPVVSASLMTAATFTISPLASWLT